LSVYKPAITPTQARNQGGEALLENFSPPWKDVLHRVWNYWT